MASGFFTTEPISSTKIEDLRFFQITNEDMILILNYTVRTYKLNVNITVQQWEITVWNFIGMFLLLSDVVSLFQN